MAQLAEYHWCSKQTLYCWVPAAVGMVIGLTMTDRLGAQPGSPPSIPAAPIPQANGQQILLPGNRPVSRQSGYTLTVDPRWINSYGCYGYRPIQITISAPQPVTNSRSVRVRLHLGWNNEINAEQEFELPSSSSSATTTVSVPVYHQWSNYIWWDIWIDGVRDKDLSLDRIAAQPWASGMAGGSANVRILVLGPAARNRLLLATNQMELAVLSLEQASWPTRWLDYSAFDVVSLSLAEAQQLAEVRPSAFEAVIRWTRAGGQLWICDAGQEWEHLPVISQLLNLSAEQPPAVEDLSARRAENTGNDGANNAAATSESNESSAVETKREAAAPTTTEGKSAESQPSTPATKQVTPYVEGWRPLRFRPFRGDGRVITFQNARTGIQRTERDPDAIEQLNSDPNYNLIEERTEPGGANRSRWFVRDSSEWFLEQPLGLGTVRAFRGPNEASNFSGKPPLANPNVLANMNDPEELPRDLALGLRRTPRWEVRHGLTPDRANPEFDRFLVLGVGRAPVTAFRVLISVFVLLIGPANYWLLKRAKRLHMMVLTVPLAALVTTAALFAYAIVADGFGTRVRAHSFSKIDQRTGEATCWTRLSYYSGLAPGQGLQMPADVAIYPILPSWTPDSNTSEQREIIWGDQEAQLTQGWLYSRTPTQYLSLRSRQSPHQIQILDSGEKLRIRNELGTTIRYLVVINALGTVYEGEDIERNGSAYLKPTAHEAAVRKFGKLLVDNMPQAPPELGGNPSTSQQVGRRSRFQYGRFGGMVNVDGRLSENLAETALADLGGLSGQPGLDLPLKSYVAVTEFGPEVDTGIPYAKVEGSFHVVQGRW